MSRKEIKIWLFIIIHLVFTTELVRWRMNILGYLPTGSEWITSLTIHLFIHCLIKITKYIIEEYKDIKRSEEDLEINQAVKKSKLLRSQENAN